MGRDYVVQASSNNGLAEATFSSIIEFNMELDQEIMEGVHEAGKAARTFLRSNSPKRTGAYSRSWGCDFSDNDFHHEAVVKNRKHWQLTHLLEDGHDVKNRKGGPVLGHVKPASPDHHIERASEVGRKKYDEIVGGT